MKKYFNNTGSKIPVCDYTVIHRKFVNTDLLIFSIMSFCLFKLKHNSDLGIVRSIFHNSIIIRMRLLDNSIIIWMRLLDNSIIIRMRLLDNSIIIRMRLLDHSIIIRMRLLDHLDLAKYFRFPPNCSTN